MECILCKMQYVGKAETAFNLRLNNYRKDTKKPNSILAWKHFHQKMSKFIIIDKTFSLSLSSFSFSLSFFLCLAQVC